MQIARDIILKEVYQTLRLQPYLINHNSRLPKQGQTNVIKKVLNFIDIVPVG